MKRLRVLYFLAAVLLSRPGSASTSVTSITSDTDWYQNGSPYILQGSLVVPKGTVLRVNSGVQVIFEGASSLEVQGDLEVEGSAAAPAVFNLIEGGLQSEVFINGGQAKISNAKFLSGVFLAKDAKLVVDGSEFTKGSGVYLQGTTAAKLKNNKIYGNATGVVLDGAVKATLLFNTLVQNTYGLVLKSYSEFVFTNNSVHNNEKDVVNQTPRVKLGGNYWGTQDEAAAQARLQGPVDLKPMRSLKDILRIYVRTQLPVITGKMSAALAAKERKQEKEDALALKKLKKQGSKAAAKAKAPAPEAPAAEAEAPEAPEAPAAQAPEAEETTPASAEVPSSPASKTVTVKTLPPAPHRLKPLANLPPAQEPGATQAASSSSTSLEDQASSLAPPSVPESQSSPASSAPSAAAPPAVPEIELLPPPVVGAAAPSTAPEADSTIPPPPGMGNSEPAPSAPAAVPPPSPAESAAPAVPAPEPMPPVPQVTVVPSAEQQNALRKLDKVSGDIDGMAPPPLDLGPDLSNPSAFDDMKNVGKPSDAKSAPATGLTIPPMKDTDVIPPKDLDLPPLDDLGNINLDSRNK